MSLVVWLPLTKDLRNQGLSNVTVTNNGATFNSAGKLGGAYSFNGSSNYLTIPQGYPGANWSYSVWAYTTSSSATQTLGCCRTAVGTAFSIFLIGGKIRIDPGANNVQWTTNYTYPINTWFHFTVTCNNGAIKYYINGEYKESYSATLASNQWGSIFSIGASQSNGSGYGNFLNGKLNDVRIYDHCLSPMEVKELSKGLVLHYPLNRGGFGNENLLSRYVVPGQAGPTSTATGGRTTWLGDYKITIPATENADTYFRLFTTKQLTTNATYTISCKVEGLLSGSYYRFPLYAQGNTAMGVLNLDHNGLCSLTFTMTYGTQAAATGADGETVYICFMDDSGRAIASGQGAITISNFKLEEDSVATPWCPNSSDALATTMGLNGTTEYDCSGFCNNGTRTGTFDWTSDTPKYSVSTTATGGASTYLEGPILPAEAQTAALWIKSKKSQNAAIFNDKTSGLQIGLLNSLLYMNSKASTAGFTTTHWIDDEWNHVVVTYDGTTRKAYINGQPETQSGASNYYIHNADNCWLWNRSYNNNYPFYGSLSDFRIYATALSADDVKSLYNNSAYIDSSGNVYGAVIREA